MALTYGLVRSSSIMICIQIKLFFQSFDWSIGKYVTTDNYLRTMICLYPIKRIVNLKKSKLDRESSPDVYDDRKQKCSSKFVVLKTQHSLTNEHPNFKEYWEALEWCTLIKGTKIHHKIKKVMALSPIMNTISHHAELWQQPPEVLS